MKLFKRILISLFPDEVINQPINPASVFISFVSAKQFFSVVNRKIVENFKLNLFDVSLDSFEVKVGFGKWSSMKPKEIDNYYSYWVVSNFNWYRFFSPSNIWSVVSLVVSIYTRNFFKWYDHRYFINFILTVYYIVFIFFARIKVFPYSDDKENYSWFIDLFFQTYLFVCKNSGFKYDENTIQQIKLKVLKNIQVFFMLFNLSKTLNKFFEDDFIDEKYYYERIFYDEQRKSNKKAVTLDFIKNYHIYTRSSRISTTEKKIIPFILPADILIRYLFEWEDVYKISELVVENIYDKDVLDNYMSSFLKNKDVLEDFLVYLLDYRLFKKNYFKWIKRFISWKFNKAWGSGIDDELDELMSSIWEWDDPDNVKIPDRLKKESVATEKLINFYLTFVWWFWVWRGDSFFLKLFRRNLLSVLNTNRSLSWMHQDSLFFYGGVLYNYSKNVFYYKYAFENVKAGKEKFSLPYRSTFKQTYSNPFLLKLFDENFLTVIFQDINQKDIKIFVQNKDIINLFKEKFGSKISSMVKYSKTWILNCLYKDFFELIWETNQNHLYKHFYKKDVSNIKENIYTFDIWVWKDFINILNNEKIDIQKRYNKESIIWICAFLRETLFWFLLYYKYLSIQEKINWVDLHLDTLKKIYIYDIVWISQDYYYLVEYIINQLVYDYDDMLNKWISIDDNSSYMDFWYRNWSEFSGSKNYDSIMWEVSWEDVIWFRGFLKNITFYNSRYLIPRE